VASVHDGSFNADFVRDACSEIGGALRTLESYHVVVIRSTLLPGVARRELLPLLEQATGKAAGRDFGLCLNPEFLREGNAIDDFLQPPRTVIGEAEAHDGDRLVQVYQALPGLVIHTNFETAETVKYLDNWWHALKIAFANEAGTLASAVGVDPDEAMTILGLDRKLNLSATYLRPGLAFGGACLPKDLRALGYLARHCDVELPLLESVLPSNAAHQARTLQCVLQSGAKRVGVLGLAFKPGTDDLRESPTVDLVAALVAEGFDAYVHDENVRLSDLLGANRAFLLDRLPNISSYLVEDPEVLCRVVDTIVLTHDTQRYRRLLAGTAGHRSVIDFTRLGSGTGEELDARMSTRWSEMAEPAAT
jgi:GDP-mannose 6-dehydrogenase